MHRRLRVRQDFVARPQDSAEALLLGEIGEMIGNFGNIDLLLPELFYNVRLRYRGMPLHVAHRIETGELESGTQSILVDAACRTDPQRSCPSSVQDRLTS